MQTLHLERVPDEIIEGLRARARSAGRSLEDQAIRELAVRVEADDDHAPDRDARRRAMIEALREGIRTRPRRAIGDTTRWIREDRDRR